MSSHYEDKNITVTIHMVICPITFLQYSNDPVGIEYKTCNSHQIYLCFTCISCCYNNMFCLFDIIPRWTIKMFCTFNLIYCYIEVGFGKSNQLYLYWNYIFCIGNYIYHWWNQHSFCYNHFLGNALVILKFFFVIL